jgi:hypothetical protein
VFRKTLTILSLIGLLLSVGLWAVSPLTIGIIIAPHGLFATGGLLSYTRSLEEFDAPTYEEGMTRYRFSWFKLGDRCYVVSKKPPRIRMMWWLPNGSFALRAPNLAGIRMPLWMPAVLFGSTLCFCRPLRHYRLRKRKKLGLCMNCEDDVAGASLLSCEDDVAGASLLS